MMKFNTLLIVMTLGTSCIGYSQKTTFDYFDQPTVYEAGISFGPMNSLTDIGGKKGNGARGLKDLNFKNTNLNAGIYGKVLYKNLFGVRLDVNFGKIEASDADLVDVKSTAIDRYSRNLSFRSKIFEVNVLGEVYPLTLFGNAGPVYVSHAFSPYILAGLGVFHFNPQTKLNSQWINLQPLRTEGEGFSEYPDRKVYHKTQIDIPFGIGARYQVSDNINLSLDFLFRKLFTDYLDDVSTTYIDPTLFQKYLSGDDLANALALNNRAGQDPQHPDRQYVSPGDRRGNSSRNDHFFSLNVKVGYVFPYKTSTRR
ncbi:MAG: hypothetical protein ABJA57_01460 [Ginsengibacter sp.]